MEIPGRWTIYCHQHTESGRRYVGLTKFKWQRRWVQHISKARAAQFSTNHWYNAIRKYGKDAFSHEVLEVCSDLDVANLAEESWIEFFDTRNPEKGFNLMKGGAHVPHSIRKNPWDDPLYRTLQTERLRVWANDPMVRQKGKATRDTPEFRAKMSAISKKMVASRPDIRNSLTNYWRGRTFSPETRAKLRNLILERNRRDPNYPKKVGDKLRGRPLSPDTIEKIRKSAMGRRHSPETCAKMSAALTGRKLSSECLEKIAAKRAVRDSERIASRTHFQCKTHGPILLGDCYRKRVRDRFRYECRQCRKDLKERWKSAQPTEVSESKE